MQRRTFLRVGLGSALVLGSLGAGLWWWRPGWADGQFTPGARRVLVRLCEAVLACTLPEEDAARARVLEGLIARLQGFAAGLPAATRAELGQLLGLMALPPGRRWLVGLAQDWDRASLAQVQAGLEQMRQSAWVLRRQTYHALRDMINATYFSDPAQWPLLGYPGPADL
ncbi:MULTISPECIES: hypothetical protein [Caldimonas]|jgi:hypothetical protein|uniref:hypothetical protein n=1 Tax=Caldimonas TaxID=196013 RepID=UPI0004773C96|nr:hypothetical protein [Caldimonas manganoxidans]